MSEELHYVPVFEIDPNVPIRTVNGKRSIYTGVLSRSMLEDLQDGTYKIGDLAFAYQPHENWDEHTNQLDPLSTNDSGIGFPCRIVDWHNVAGSKVGELRALVYLEIDTAYAIVDRRESVSNDEGTSDGDDRAYQGRVPGLEESASEPRRPYGTSVAM